jgi:hypothetical protein
MDLNAKKINESLEKSEATELKPWYRTNKYGDWILDHIAYGWRVYYKYYDVKRWIISTYQRIRYGVSDSECWSLDWTLTNFILPRLKHFKKINVHTYPPDITPERWNEILDELIWTFEYMHDEEKFNPTPMFRYEVDNMDDYFKNIKREKTPEQKQAWDEYLKKNEELEERRKKGMLLFAEYYQQLWD